jgi:hypothetical protein
LNVVSSFGRGTPPGIPNLNALRGPEINSWNINLSPDEEWSGAGAVLKVPVRGSEKKELFLLS